MTREEAIEILWRYDVNFEPRPPEEVMHAIDMAIEALQAEYEDYEHATLVDIKEPLVKHDREWIIGCIKHDGFIKTDRFDKANQIILDALQTDLVRCKDCKWAEKAILDDYCVECTMYHTSCAKHGYCHHGERREPG